MSDLPTIDVIGYTAAGLVLATFCMGSMGALRWVAIVSNLAFIAYGYLGGLAPVLLLHMLLLPVNAYRLARLYRTNPTERDARMGEDRHPRSSQRRRLRTSRLERTPEAYEQRPLALSVPAHMRHWRNQP